MFCYVCLEFAKFISCGLFLNSNIEINNNNNTSKQQQQQYEYNAYSVLF